MTEIKIIAAVNTLHCKRSVPKKDSNHQRHRQGVWLPIAQCSRPQCHQHWQAQALSPKPEVE